MVDQDPHLRERLSAGDRSWLPKSACADMDTSLFMQPTRTQETQEALAVCGICKVSEECLDYALRYNVPGVAGGLTEEDRDNYKRRHRRARKKEAS